MIINPFPAPFPFKKGGLNTQSPRACYSQHKYLSPVFGLRLVLSQLSRVAELNKKVWESEYYWSKAYIVSVAREGHGSAHLNRVADVAGHFKKGAGTWNEVENIQSGNTCHIWLLLQS